MKRWRSRLLPLTFCRPFRVHRGILDTVLETILANATRLCEANFGVLLLYEGAQFRVAAAHNLPTAYAELRRRHPVLFRLSTITASMSLAGSC